MYFLRTVNKFQDILPLLPLPVKKKERKGKKKNPEKLKKKKNLGKKNPPNSKFDKIKLLFKKKSNILARKLGTGL